MQALTYDDLVNGFARAGLRGDERVIVHASLSSLGHVEGGAKTVVWALRSVCPLLVMPAFTYGTCAVWPPQADRPGNAALTGREAEAANRRARPFARDLPADSEIGAVAEVLRQEMDAVRSDHPTHSFVAVGDEAHDVTAAQWLDEPLGPLAWLRDRDADVVLIGVGHTRNTAVHLAEQEAGRMGFLRYALTVDGPVACPNSPGCSEGFDAVEPLVQDVTQEVTVGAARVRRVPLRPLTDRARDLIRRDPTALLCGDDACARCNALRQQAPPLV